jgi:hypothetical protein
VLEICSMQLGQAVLLDVLGSLSRYRFGGDLAELDSTEERNELPTVEMGLVRGLVVEIREDAPSESKKESGIPLSCMAAKRGFPDPALSRCCRVTGISKLFSIGVAI